MNGYFFCFTTQDSRRESFQVPIRTMNCFRLLFSGKFSRYRVLNGGTQRHVSPVNLWIFFCSNFKFKILLIHFFRLFPRLAPVFNCPLIWSSSMDPHTFVLSLIHEHLNPSYVVDHMSLDYSFSFWHRVNQLWAVSRVIYYKW